MTQDSLTPLHDRLKAIDEQIEALTKERHEVMGAVEVFNRYVQPQEANKVVVAKAARKSAAGAPRPENIPTIWEMTEEVLKSSPNGTMTIDEIVCDIAETWWPGVVKPQIAPTIYNFAKPTDGRLDKPSKGTFRLRKNEKPSDDKLGGKTSEGSLFETQAKGREAVPGGGP